MPPVALGMFFMFMYDMFEPFQFYFEKSLFIMAASVSGALLNIVLNYFFISPRWLNLGYMAAGYTTLICYILYALGHYICMRWVCRKHMDNVRVYDVKILLGISVGCIAVGLLVMLTYQLPVVRYSLVGVSALAVVIFRKPLIAYGKKLLSIRRSAKENQ